MTLGPLDVVCGTCGNRFRATPKRTFLGFLQFKCPSCAAEVLQPLSGGYRVAYWIILFLLSLVVYWNASNGQVTLAPLFAIGVIIALLNDALLRRLRKRQRLKSPALNNQPSQTPATEIGGPTLAKQVPSRGINRIASQVLSSTVGILVILGAFYGVRSAMRWYRETTFKGDTPYMRSLVRSLREQGAYEKFWSLVRSTPTPAASKNAMARLTRMGSTLLGPEDQARRIELLDHQLSGTPANDCAAIGRGSRESEAAQLRMFDRMDSLTLVVFTTIVARAFLAAEQNPGYQIPTPSDEEMVAFVTNAASSLPEGQGSLLITTLANVESAPDADVCWATRALYRYALSQEGLARASTIRLLTLIEASQGVPQ